MSSATAQTRGTVGETSKEGMEQARGKTLRAANTQESQKGPTVRQHIKVASLAPTATARPDTVIDSEASVVEELPSDHRIIGLRSARLRRKDPNGGRDEPIVFVDLLNSTPEPDGTVKRYLLRVDPNAYGGDASRHVQAAVASTWRNADGSLTFSKWQDYDPNAES